MDGWAPAGFTDAVEIGRGGFGTVYKATDVALGRVVAVKRLDARLDEQGHQRFSREGRVMSSLSNHPNVVPVYTVGVDQRGPFLVMPYLSRGSLGDRVRRGPLRWDEAAHVLVRLCGAVESAHGGNVIHRDIKPDNVLQSDFGEPQLTDFGIARMSGEWATSDGTLTGSLPYTAPEILAGGHPSVATDVYALGATLLHLLTGRAPFTRDDDTSAWQLYQRIMGEPVPEVPGIPPALGHLVQATMAKDPAWRPPSAAALGRALQEVQRSVGLAPTEMVVAGTDPGPGSAPRPGVPSGPTPPPVRPTPPPVTATGSGARPRRTPWLVAAAVATVLVVLVAAFALTRPRDGDPQRPGDPIGLATGDGSGTTVAGNDPGGPGGPGGPNTARGPNGEQEADVTPGGKPAPLTEAGTSVDVTVAASTSARLRFTASPGQRALLVVRLRKGSAQGMALSIDRDDVQLDTQTLYGGPDTVVGPARIGSGGDYSAVISPGPRSVDVTMIVKLAPADATAELTVGAPGARVRVATPYQTAVARFTGRKGEKVVGRWKGPSITDSANLTMFDSRHEELVSWTGGDDAESDVVVLGADGPHTIEVTYDDDATGAGQLSVERR